MPPLYTCRACGFLSTLWSEFKCKDGVLFDKACLERAEWSKEAARWIAEAIEADRGETARLSLRTP